MNINKVFNNYIKQNFCGLSACTLIQVLTDWMCNGWETGYFDKNTFFDDYDRWLYIERSTENETPVIRFQKVNKTYMDIYNKNELKIEKTSFTQLASCIVNEDLFFAFTKHNNQDLIDKINDIVKSCPYL